MLERNNFMNENRSKYNPVGVLWIVYKEGHQHMIGTSKDLAKNLNISQDFLRQLAHRKKVYKGVYTIKRKGT